MPFDFDAVVVGAGCVGLATGYAFARRGLSTLVLEAGPRIGEGVSSRNSEVIHAGLHYQPGSLKARVCVEGRRALYQFLESHDVAHSKCGKLLVATEPAEIPALERLAAHAQANGVENLRWLSGAEAMALEPGLKAAAALESPESGIMDSHGYMLALQGEIEDRGGVVALQSAFSSASPLLQGGFAIEAGGASLTAARLVTAPGMSAQRVAAAIEGFPREMIPPLHFGKGVYFRLSGRAPFQRLIYPPPVPGALGVHYRRDLGGQACFGPDLQYVEAETYDVDPSRRGYFEHYIRRFWPGLPDGALQPDYAGIRPKIHGPGEPQPDFRLDGPAAHGIAGLVCFFGIESPGLTSSLALGEAAAAEIA